MTKLTKTQKVTRWASEKKERNLTHMMNELGMATQEQLINHLRRVKRFGLINYTIQGKSVKLSLTLPAYYNRAFFVA